MFNKENKISTSEIIGRFEHWNDLVKVQKLFSAMDANKDDEVSKEDYNAFWISRVKNKKTTLPALKSILIKIVAELNDREDLSFDLTTIYMAIKSHAAIFGHVKDKLA